MTPWHTKEKKRTYKGIDIERREHFNPGPRWKVCGEDYGYGLFRNIKPRDHAVTLIHQVFSDSEIKVRRFVYDPHRYRGRQSMMDSIEVYCKEK